MAGTELLVEGLPYFRVSTLRAASSTPQNSLEAGFQVDTLQDGAVSYVFDQVAEYRWFADSVAAPVDPSVIIPLGQALGIPGRWIVIVAGAQGPQGPQGPAGGPQGPQGDTGPQGAQGDAGPQGVQGDTGSQGPQGDDGTQGPQGLTGPQGVQGDTGSQGPQGDGGAQGPQGLTGPQGVQGDTGSQGPQGDDGAQGPQGLTGPQGPQGDVGAQGPQGNDGAQGPQGDDGAQGPQGLTGSQGPQGFSGSESGSPSSWITVTDTGSVNNYSPAGWDNANGILFNNASILTITGFAAPTATGQREKMGQCTGAGGVDLTNESGSSAEANKISVSSAFNSYSTGDTFLIRYDDTNTRWRILGGVGAV